MAPVAETVAQTRRQLASARTAADQLGQKVALLEQQRDQVDRATAKLKHLTALMQRADTGLERQADIVRAVTELRIQLDLMGDSHAACRNVPARSPSAWTGSRQASSPPNGRWASYARGSIRHRAPGP